MRTAEVWPAWAASINVSQGGETMGWWQVRRRHPRRQPVRALPARGGHRVPDSAGQGGARRTRASAAWLDAHHASYRERLAGDPVTALLVPSALGATLDRGFLTPTPTADGEEAFEKKWPGSGRRCRRPRSRT